MSAMRPWESHEFPIQAVFRFKIQPETRFVFHCVDSKCAYNSMFGGYNFDRALLELDYSDDACLTWHPCGVVK